MGFWDTLMGDDAADAARAAAQDQYAKQKAAVSELFNYGDQYANQFRDLSRAYDPYVQTGYTSNNALQRLLSDPNSLRDLPGYQFAMDEGLGAIDRSAAARGMSRSGATLKALQRYGTGLADQTYGNQLQRLLSANQQGFGATQAQVGTVGTGLQGQLGTRQLGYGGQMQSAGTIGQGDIAAANAQAAGAQNLLNFGGNLLGKALGAFGGGGLSSFIGGSSGGGFYGGSPETNPLLRPF
jgi:hypothetical protein